MIRVSRARQDENGKPIKPNAAWDTLADGATTTALAEAAAHKASDAVYGHAQVRMALEKLFYDKCSYCETVVTATSDWDVEHFRPKGRVAENANHPGYFWLAYKWVNLFLACTYCNQKRQDKPRWGDLSAGPAAGKLDQFPLSSEANRAQAPADAIDQEDPLLLNPCDGPDPEAHLRHTPAGSIVPRTNSAKGQASIAVYHLNRKRLRDFRRRSIEDTVGVMKLIRKAETDGNVTLANELKAYCQRYRTDERIQHAGAAREVVRDPVAFGIA